MSDEPKQWWQTAPAIMAASATFLTAITGLLVALNQFGVFKQSDPKPPESQRPAAVEEPIAPVAAAKSPQKPQEKEPAVDRLPLGRVSLMAAQANSVKALATYLEKKGAEVSIISAGQFDELSTSRPDIVIIGADTEAIWTGSSKTMLNRLFENSKIIAFGKGGTTLFRQLGLKISDPNGMHGNGSRLAVQIPELLQSPLAVPADDKVVEIYHSGQADVVGIYDEGSPTVAGFEGIARWTDQKSHWPICRQGNYLLWGFNAPAGDMTEAGQQLFINLLVNHKTRPAAPLSQARTKTDYVKSGIISDRISKQFPGQTWPFQTKRTGHIRARLSWSPPDLALSFILSTEQRRRFQRRDGPSPLTIDFEVNEEDLAHSDDDWRIGVQSFGDLGAKVIDYKLELSIPSE